MIFPNVRKLYIIFRVFCCLFETFFEQTFAGISPGNCFLTFKPFGYSPLMKKSKYVIKNAKSLKTENCCFKKGNILNSCNVFVSKLFGYLTYENHQNLNKSCKTSEDWNISAVKIVKNCKKNIKIENHNLCFLG